jgi:hypothetical protein
MPEYTRRQNTTLSLLGAAMFALAACGGDTTSDATLAGDSALGRDLAMARDSVAQPQLQDVPAPTPEPAPVAVAPAPTPRPAAPRPTPRPTPRPAAPARAATPAPAAAAPVTGTIAAGTALTFASNSKVCSNTQGVGEKFTATLSEPVSGSNGIDIPSGATGTFEVTDAKTAKNSNDNTNLSVRLLSVTFGGRTYPVESTTQTASTTRVRSATTSDDAKKVAGGAIIGAIAGQVLGKNTKGTVIGAAAGAAAGTAAAAATANYDTCLNSGGAVTVRLDAPATVRAVATP